MRELYTDEMSDTLCGKKLSAECVESIVGEFAAWGSMFFVTSVLTGGIAVASLLIAPVGIALFCQ